MVKCNCRFALVRSTSRRAAVTTSRRRRSTAVDSEAKDVGRGQAGDKMTLCLATILELDGSGYRTDHVKAKGAVTSETTSSEREQEVDGEV